MSLGSVFATFAAATGWAWNPKILRERRANRSVAPHRFVSSPLFLCQQTHVGKSNDTDSFAFYALQGRDHSCQPRSGPDRCVPAAAPGEMKNSIARAFLFE